MRCPDCGAQVPAVLDACPACGCPADPLKAVKCLETRLAAARTEALRACGQLRKARAALFAAALFALIGAVTVLAHAGADSLTLATGIFMLGLSGGYAAMALLVHKAPLPFSIAGLLLGCVFLGGLPGMVIVAAAALGLWFAVQYTRTKERPGLLEHKIEKLKKCTERSI